MNRPIIKIAVVSDVVCPWCYIGKRRLEKAINLVSNEFDFEIQYYPFELNPEMPANGVNQKEYLINKFGGEEQYEKITGQTSYVASLEGLEFNFDKQRIAPNTRNAHRLILFAREEGKQLELVEGLFKAYFTDGVNLSDESNLIDVAVKAGLDRDTVETILQSDAGLKEVVKAEKELQAMGVRGVPFYIINDKYGISGAQPSETFVQAFRNIALETVAGQTCEPGQANC
jgi:predicted DsbA family dithiol-disulfide isomerase